MRSATKSSLDSGETRKVRVLACAFSCRPGGSEGFSGGEDLLGWNLVAQIARWHPVWVITFAGNRAAIESALQRQPLSNVHFEYLDLPGWLRPFLRFQGSHQLYAYLWQIRAYFAAKKLHRQIQFDLFHHITYANDWMASFIGARLPIPYVRGPGGGAHRTPSEFSRQYSLRGRLSEQLRVFGQWLFRHDPFFAMGQNRARAILVCNREAMAGLPERWKRKALYFPVNAVTAEDLVTVSPEGSHDEFRVLSAGKLIRLKGFALAIRAFKLFAADHSDAHLEIIGEGPDRAFLQNLIDELQLQNSVFLSPWMPRDQVLDKMRACDVFLFASLRDGGGAVVVEAMAAGKPVVCLDIGGPGLHVMDETGIKVPAGAPEQAVRDLARALEKLHADRALCVRLGSAARARAEQFYHLDRLGERLEQVYRRALDQTDLQDLAGLW